MSRITALMAGAALLLPVPALADELIREANDQESLAMGVAHVHASEQALDSRGSSVVEEESGSQLQIGYGTVRTRALFGVPGFYTNLEIFLGGADMGYAGSPFNPMTGAVEPNDGGFDVATESVRLRVGRSREFGADGRVALTPFLGLSQQAWLRNSSTDSPFSAYNHVAAEIGILAQASLTRKLVLGTDASLGRTLDALLLDGHNLTWPHNATTSSFALYLDNRTYADWHQRLEIRQSFLRYGEPAYSGGLFEPRRNSTSAIMLEMGTEKDLFKTLFY